MQPEIAVDSQLVPVQVFPALVSQRTQPVPETKW